MKLHYRFYKFEDRSGILFMHQRSGFAFGSEIIERTHDAFLLSLHQILSDQDSTKIGVVDDQGNSEIKAIESAKARALRSLPQSSQYWGSELYMVHCNAEAAYIKVPSWVRVKYLLGSDLFELDPSSQWQIVQKYDSIFVDLRQDHNETSLFLNQGHGSLRLATFFAPPRLQANPCWTLSNREAA